MYDVIVIGAGPSGLNAARKLAEEKLDVLVLERKREIGKHVVCTGIVSQKAFQEFDLPRGSILREIKKIKLVSPSANSLTYEHPHTFAYVIDREKFDQYLSEKARSKGVEIKQANEVIDVSRDKNCVDVVAKIEGKNHKKYSAQMAIIATGINYNLHKKNELGYPKDFLNGVQAEIEISDVDCTHVFVGRNIASGAFAWMVPIGRESVRIGLMTEKDPKDCFHRLIQNFYPHKIKDLDRNRIQFKAIAQGLVSKNYSERMLTVGEAAGQVKTTTGGGVYFGLVCSDIASRVVVRRFEERCFSAKALSEYERLWKKALQKEILIGYYTRKICSKLSDSQIEKMFHIVQNDGVIPLIRERGNFDWHGDLLLMLLKRLPLFKILKEKGLRL